jgi:multiple sugar transport system permease protein
MPWLLGFILFTLGPMLASAYLSLTRYTLAAPPKFAGLANYRRMFFADAMFWPSIANTLYYAFTFVPLSVAGSLTCALLLNQKAAGQSFFRSIYFLPSITPVIATVILWIWLLQPQVGLVNLGLSLLGIAQRPGWLGDPNWSKPALILISLWGAVGGGNMLILLAGLQGIPLELEEAAQIDGAGAWRRFVSITLPMLSSSILFCLVIGLIGALQQFTLAYVATSGSGQLYPPGGPAHSTLFYGLHLFNNAFGYWEMGYACALAWVFFVAVLGLTIIQLRGSRAWVYYGSEQEEPKW